MFWLALALPFLFPKRSSSSSSSPASSFTPDPDSELARFMSGPYTATLYARPRPTWRLVQASSDNASTSVLGQGAGKSASELVRPMLEAFADASSGRPITAYMFARGQWVTIFVFADAESWAWRITDGAQVVEGPSSPSRGVALLAAMSRAEDGPAPAEAPP